MNLILSNFAIVVVAANHNPSIVTHSFLVDNGIIPANFKLQSGDNLWTDVVSQLVYEQGVSISIDQQRATFSEAFTTPDSEGPFQCPSIAERFIDTLRFVNYTAIGINPKGFVFCENPNQVLLDSLIKEGPWKSFKDSSPQIQMTLGYSYEKKKKLAFTIGTGKGATLSSQRQECLGFQANIHYDIQIEGKEHIQKARVERAKEIIGNCQEDMKEFKTLVNDSFLKRFFK